MRKKFKGLLIKSLSSKDIELAKSFQSYINSLIKENIELSLKKKKTLKEEIVWLKEKLKQVKKKENVFLLVKDEDKVIGEVGVGKEKGKKNHVGVLGISIAKNYRGIGLGDFLMKEVIELTKKRLNIKIIRLSVFSTNKRAIKLYKKHGFEKVAVIPKQIKHKGKFVDEVVMILYL